MEEISATLGGFTLSGTDGFGVSWKVNDVENWDAPPSTTGRVEQKAGADGGWVPPAFFEPHPLRLVGRMIAPDRPTLKAAVARFNGCLPLKLLKPFAVTEDGVDQHRWVRVEGAVKIARPTDTYASFDVQFVAPDYRLLGGDGSQAWQFQQTVYLPVTTGGRIWPAKWPYTIAATVIGNSVTLADTGDAQPPVMIRINGPVTRPVIRDDEGSSMLLDLTLTIGQWVDVNLDARTIKLNGTASRRNTLRGKWIVPRSGMTLRYESATYNPTTSMTVFWTHAD